MWNNIPSPIQFPDYQAYTNAYNQWWNSLDQINRIRAMTGMGGQVQNPLTQDLYNREHQMFNSGQPFYHPGAYTPNPSLPSPSTQAPTQNYQVSPMERVMQPLQKDQMTQRSVTLDPMQNTKSQQYAAANPVVQQPRTQQDPFLNMDPTTGVVSAGPSRTPTQSWNAPTYQGNPDYVAMGSGVRPWGGFRQQTNNPNFGSNNGFMQGMNQVAYAMR